MLVLKVPVTVSDFDKTALFNISACPLWCILIYRDAFPIILFWSFNDLLLLFAVFAVVLNDYRNSGLKSFAETGDILSPIMQSRFSVQSSMTHALSRFLKVLFFKDLVYYLLLFGDNCKRFSFLLIKFK